MNASRVIQKDIALACGYTINTVSRALRGDPRLPEETRKKIRDTAFHMGYIRNSLASSLRSGRSQTVAVIVNDVHNMHFCNMLNRMDRALRDAGYNMMILCMQLNEELGEELIHAAISQSVAGILYFPYHNNRAHIAYMEKNRVPFVLLDRRIDGVVTNGIRCDDEKGGYLAGKHLLDLGHRRFLFLSGVNQSSSQIDRLAGFFRALDEAGVPRGAARVVPGEAVEAALTAGDMRSLLLPLDYTGIISFRDEISYMAMKDLRSLRVSIPEDVSLVSFDHLRGDIPYLPQLTSIYAADGHVAESGVRLLLSRIAQPDLPPQAEVLPVKIYDEGTTAPPKAAPV